MPLFAALLRDFRDLFPRTAITIGACVLDVTRAIHEAVERVADVALILADCDNEEPDAADCLPDPRKVN